MYQGEIETCIPPFTLPELPESFDKMKEEVGRTEDLSFVKERVQKLRSEHTSDLERLYDYHAEDYLNEATDRYRSKCELDPALAATFPVSLAYLVPPSLLLSDHEFPQEISGPHKEAKTQLDWANDYEALRYSYLSAFISLKRQQVELEVKEELERRQQKQMFPQSKGQFGSKPNDAKIRVARFLVADPMRQEKMLGDFQWAWRQVKPLMDIFTKDVSSMLLSLLR